MECHLRTFESLFTEGDSQPDVWEGGWFSLERSWRKPSKSSPVLLRSLTQKVREEVSKNEGKAKK